MRFFRLFPGLLLAIAAWADEPGTVLTPEAAAKAAGQVVTVRGEVACVSKAHTSDAIYLNFGAGYPKQIFSVKYFPKDGRIPYFHGRTVEATGKVLLTRTGPQMEIHDPATAFRFLPVDEAMLDRLTSELDGRAARESFVEAWKQVFLAGDFARIEKKAAEYRENQSRFADGNWALPRLYSGVTTHDEGSTAETWKNHFRLLDEWDRQFPNSETAQLARAQTLAVNAWEIDHPDDSIPNPLPTGESNAGEMAALLKLAIRGTMKLAGQTNTSLREAADILKKREWDDPEAWRIWQIGDWKDAPRRQEQVFQEGTERFPGFIQFYTERAKQLARTENGPDSWEDFAARVRTENREEGRELYARIVWAMNTEFYSRNVFQQSQASWEWTREGFDDMLKRYPESRWLLNSFARLCWYANDRATARRLIPLIGNQPDMSVWYGEGYYEDFVFWSRQED